MPDYLRYEPVTGRIVQKWISADPSRVEGLPNILQVTRAEAEGITKYHIVDNGVLRLMTQAEKDALDLEEANAQHQSLLDRIDKYNVTNLDLLTALVKVINKRIPSNPITKQEFVTQLRADLNV